MDRDTAKRLIEALTQLGNSFGDITAITYRLTDETERKAFRRKVAEVMHQINFELLMPIVRQHPDLDPDKQEK